MGSPALTMVANCFENIKISSTLTFFLPLNKEKLLFFFFPSAFFFLDLNILVMIIFFSFRRKEASSIFKASISPSTYFPSVIPL